VEQTAQAVPMVNGKRPTKADRVVERGALGNAPAKAGGYFVCQRLSMKAPFV